MATHDYELANPPTDKRELELWLQHAAGKIVFEDARQYAINKIDSKISSKSRDAAIKAIDDAIYGMMMIFDGVAGCLENTKHSVRLETLVTLSKKNESGDTVQIEGVRLSEGDEMCMGYHGWVKNDYGKRALVTAFNEST